VTLNGLCSVITQKRALFTTTALWEPQTLRSEY
jgi:hypothetical protein